MVTVKKERWLTQHICEEAGWVYDPYVYVLDIDAIFFNEGRIKKFIDTVPSFKDYMIYVESKEISW